MESLSEVIQALQVLYQNTNADSKKQANQWLEDFQKRVEAWIVADSILQKDEFGIEAKLFAAQTLRYKVINDFKDLDANSSLSLKNSLIQRLFDARTSAQVLHTQLCLTLSDIALQLPEWEDPVGEMISSFSVDPNAIKVLLEFLTVLPEEVLYNDRIVVERSVYTKTSNNLLTIKADQVVQLLVNCLQDPQCDSDIHIKVLNCFSSWLKSGELTINALQSTPLLDFAFLALEYDDDSVFETAVDAICGYIFECKDPGDSDGSSEQNEIFLKSLQAILIKLSHLSQIMKADKSITEDADIDRMRGYCRVFTEAGDAWVKKMVLSPLDFQNLLDSMLFVMRFPCLDILPMTFNFWNDLSNTILDVIHNLSPEQRSLISEFYSSVFNNLIEIVIVHLRYPLEYDGFTIQEEGPTSQIINSNSSIWTAKDRDDFSDFRHTIGDVLKDSVNVIGQELALQKPFNLLMETLNNASQSNDVPWQIIEAPLFALRAMGSEIDPNENGIMIQIMDLIPKLPFHPKIRYACTLVIGRYTEWTFSHPQYIEFQLEYIIKGFEIKEVIAASAQALKYLCKDCSTYLTGYWKQLESFYSTFTVSGKLVEADILDLTEALAHVINGISIEELPLAFEAFCLPLIKALENHLNTVPNEQVSTIEVSQILSRLSTLLKHMEKNKSAVNHAIVLNLINILWPLLIKSIDMYAHNFEISESAGRLLKTIMTQYSVDNSNIYSEGIQIIASAYQRTCYGVYIWVGKKFVEKFGSDVYLPANSVEVARSEACSMLVDRLTEITINLVSEGVLNYDSNPEPIEEMYLLLAVALQSQTVRTIKSNVFLQALEFSISAMMSIHYYVQESVLEMWASFISPSVRHLKRYRDALEASEVKFYIPVNYGSSDYNENLIIGDKAPLPPYKIDDGNFLNYDIRRVSLVISNCGFQISKTLLLGLMTFTNQDLLPLSISIFTNITQFISEGTFIMKTVLPNAQQSQQNILESLEMNQVDLTALEWANNFLNQLPPHVVMSQTEKDSFLNDFKLHLSTRHWQRLRHLLSDFSHIFRKKNLKTSR
ncbi:hypothetical protein BB561_002582 [Smittium simulii]|uniref:Importin N-terminal domain-containing protein n=1 Tax=Smittium simulii TaxID=133385 RepID=A0A2T9YPV2_9FUNG|nr:hypothetical protein BB561_002582 [Smittium simulii]